MKRGLLVMLIVSTLIAVPVFAQKAPVLQSVAFTCQDLQNPFFNVMANAVKKAAQDIGGSKVRVMVQSCDNDLNKQSQQIDDFIAAGAQIIVVNATDSNGIGPAVARAKAAGIVVIASDVTAAGGVDATMTSDNYQAGVITAEYIAKRLNYRGNVVAIIGDPNSSLDRYFGFRDIMKKYPNIKILSDTQNGHGRRVDSMNIMTDLLTAFPHIDAVWCINDPSALGAMLAIKQANREKEMFVVGVDGSPDAADAMKQPGSIFAASAAQDPYYMAYHAVEVGWQVMNGKKPANPTELIPVKLITQDDVRAGYSGWPSK